MGGDFCGAAAMKKMIFDFVVLLRTVIGRQFLIIVRRWRWFYFFAPFFLPASAGILFDWFLMISIWFLSFGNNVILSVFASKMPFQKKLLTFAVFASIPLPALLSSLFAFFFYPLCSSAFQRFLAGEKQPEKAPEKAKKKPKKRPKNAKTENPQNQNKPPKNQINPKKTATAALAKAGTTRQKRKPLNIKNINHKSHQPTKSQSHRNSR